MARHEVRGKVKTLQGRGKEIFGILTGNTALELEGDRDQAQGKVQESLGKPRRKLDELVDKDRAARTIKR
jgi:uncharacterized protein YjbJ (UPF0337 family)